jgi:uncharacterized membrane protein YhaH (DUF805 family)
LDNVLGLTISPEFPYGVFYVAYVLAMFIPSLAVVVRRLHDVGKGGGWFFIILVPFIGSLWLLVLMCTDSVADNRFGPNPKAPKSVI